MSDDKGDVIGIQYADGIPLATLQDLCDTYFKMVYVQTGFNSTETARILGISQKTTYKIRQRLGLPKKPKPTTEEKG